VVWDPEGGNAQDPGNLQFLAQIPQVILPQQQPHIETMLLAPSDIDFGVSDAILACRILRMNF
jgi:hypothetical protein